MPCETYTREEEMQSSRKRYNILLKKSDQAHMLLCEVCTAIAGQDEFDGNPDFTIDQIAGLRTWWENHQVEDRQREKDREEERLEKELDRQKRVKRLKDEIATLEGEPNE